MTWIKHVPPELAEGTLKQVYKSISASRRNVAAAHQALSLHPEALRAHWEFYKAILTYEDGLSRLMKERICLLVAVQRKCDYLKRHHAETLRQHGEDTDARLALEEGRIPLSMDEDARALLRWVLRVSQKPEMSTESDLDDLRRIGFSDREILDATLTIGYFHFLTSLVEILGVQLEPWFSETCGPVSDDDESDEDSLRPDDPSMN